MAIKEWTGYVNATSETPMNSELNLKKGSKVTIVASGEASICQGSDKHPYVGPTGECKKTLPNLIARNEYRGALLIKNGDILTPIGGGLIDWPVPNDNNMEFIINDIPGGYHDNLGGFWVTLKYNDQDLLA